MKVKSTNVYLTYDGNCREAFEFYKQCFGGELFLMKYSDGPGCEEAKLPPGSADRIMHAGLRNGAAMLMASDAMPGHPFQQGNNFSVTVSSDANEEVDKYCTAVSKGGAVTMAPQETFYAHRFAMCTDKFGINWMFIREKPMQ